MLKEVLPIDKSITTKATMLSFSKMSNMIITKFKVSCLVDGSEVYSMDTAFGFFPEEAMAAQKGLPVLEKERELRHKPAAKLQTLAELSSKVAGPKLAMIDAVEHYDEAGGSHGKGYIRAVKSVKPSDWFFKAHFFQDPVQPGSLGIEAMVQAMKSFLVLRCDLPENGNFEALALNEDLSWRYRGQVTPDISEVHAEFDVSHLEQDNGRYFAKGSARLWIGDRKIYEAPEISMAYVSRELTPERHYPLNQWVEAKPGALKLKPIYEQMGQTKTVVQQNIYDVFAALTRQFVSSVYVEDPIAMERLKGKPVLYLANHQVGVESLLFMTLMKALNGNSMRAIAKAEHQSSVYGQLQDFRDKNLGGVSPIGMYFFDRKDRMSIFSCLEQFAKERSELGVSLLCHVEGTRAFIKDQDVKTVSSIFIDLAKKHQLPIVPVCFVGGLPVENSAKERYEYPYGLGKQQYRLGRPIMPEEFASLGLKDAINRVLVGINSLQVNDFSEMRPDSEFSKRVSEFESQGAGRNEAVLWASLSSYGSEEPRVELLKKGILDHSIDAQTLEMLKIFS